MSTAAPSPTLLLRLAGIFTLSLLLAPFAPAQTLAKAPPLSDAIILIVRHAEKPEEGWRLSPEGERRAQLYVDYFQGLQIDGKPLKLDHLIAAADSKNSSRSRLTLTPLSHALRRPVDLRFKTEETHTLARELRKRENGKCLLICWHHGDIPDLLEELGANSEKLLPDGEWPKDVFNWVVILRYDAQGHLIPKRSRRITQQWAR